MYKNNIYIDNYEELSAITLVPELMSADDKKLLGL